MIQLGTSGVDFGRLIAQLLSLIFPLVVIVGFFWLFSIKRGIDKMNANLEELVRILRNDREKDG